MKTKEEILREVTHDGKTYTADGFLIEHVLEAMQKYADQFRQPVVSGNEANPLSNFAELWQALDNIGVEKYATARDLILKYIYSAKNKKDGEVAVCEHNWVTLYDGSEYQHCSKCDERKKAN